MQQFTVPQFIDVEDKVIGPITVRQFIILLVGAGFIFVAYRLSDFALFVLLFALIGGITLVIAFVKINGRPIHYFFLNFLQTSKRPRLRIWGKMVNLATIKKDSAKQDDDTLLVVPHKEQVGSSRLAELSLIADTGGVYSSDETL